MIAGPYTANCTAKEKRAGVHGYFSGFLRVSQNNKILDEATELHSSYRTVLGWNHDIETASAIL